MQQKTAIAFLITSLSLASVCSAEVMTFQLKDGASMTVHGVQASRVIFNVWTKSGAAEDGADAGMSLLATKIVKKTMYDSLKKRGVNTSVAGYAAHDYSFWALDVAPQSVEPTMVALGEALRNPDFALFERKRAEVVIETSRQKREPFRAAYNQFLGRLYPGHPYGHPAEGSAETLKGITLEKLKDYMAAKWGAPQIALVAAGDVSSGPLASTFSYSFTGLATGSASPSAFPETKAQFGVAVCNVEASRSAVVVGASGPDMTNLRQGLAFDLLATILQNRQTEATTSINVWWEYRKGPGLFGMGCEAETTDEVDRLTNQTLSDIESLRSGAFSLSEVSRAQEQLISNFQQIQADPKLLTRQSGLFTALGHQTIRDTYVPLTRQISQKEIQEIAIRYLATSRIIVSKAYGR